jgi:SpoIID/LytB domain protein
MLKPHLKPDKEPLIRVGIVLPEDHVEGLTITFPETPGYKLLSDSGYAHLKPGTNLTFSLSQQNKINSEFGLSASFRVEPVENYSLKPSLGIKVNDILAGRGFHWQKTVDVILPGSVELKIYSKRFILINELPLEEYLICVATSEMAADCPTTFVEVQTIAARSWMLANIEQKHVSMDMDVCNDDCCQRYQGSSNLTEQSIEGAKNTSGQVITHDKKICDARYSKSCGGIMESFHTIWGGNELKYLQNMVDAPHGFTHPSLPLSEEKKVIDWIDSIPETFCSPYIIPESSLTKFLGIVDEEGSYFRWWVTYGQNEIVDILNRKLKLEAASIIAFKPLKRGGSGRISKLEIIYITGEGSKESYIIKSEYNIRQSLHKGFLYSSCFYVVTEIDNRNMPIRFTFRGAGWGHGVGLCQIGALGMSLKGYTTKQILAHYYPGSVLEKIY